MPADEKFSYWPEEEILFVGHCVNKTFGDKKTIDLHFAESTRYWRQNCNGKKIYFVVDFTGSVVDPKVVDYFGVKLAEIVSAISYTAVRYGADLQTRAALRAMAVKTHLSSNLYASRDEAIEVVRGIRRGKIQLETPR